MLAGDEKRIQALFCELALEDRSRTPRFEKLWRGAEATASLSTVRHSRRPSATLTDDHLLPRTVLTTHLRDLSLASRLSLAVITTAAVLTALVYLALWVVRPADMPPQQQLAAGTSINETSPSQRERLLIAFTPAKPSPRKVASRRSTRAKARNTIIQKAAAISNWQSPTDIFMESPADSVLKSVPQLNQSVRELESFLPNNEVKESNP